MNPEKVIVTYIFNKIIVSSIIIIRYKVKFNIEKTQVGIHRQITRK
jgi:hypothetical protein